MPENIIKLKGPLKTADPSVGGGAKWNYPVLGIVKDNIDPTRSGRIKVLIGDKSPQDSNNSDAWITVSYMSTFFGSISGSGGSGDYGTYKANPSSYGQWNSPPDIGTTVVCIFINGDPNYGFYIGCVPDAESLHMVPAIGSSDNILANEGEANSYGGATRLPVTNFNTNNKDLADSTTFNNSPRPVHSYSAAIMNQQGILRDPIRGPISSSASREAASRVGWGVSSPGRPIYEGGYDDATIASNLETANNQQLKVVARRGGHSIVMDDGDVIGRDQLVRIRTALGHQILMSDDGQTLMILHSNGQSYVELGKEGTVDIYSTNSFNVRTQGDINFHADRNINIHAMENLNIQAKNIQTNSEESTKLRSGKDFNVAATGKLTGLAGGAIAWGAGGDASLVGGGQAYVNGSKVNLNSGAPSTSPESISPLPVVAQTDTLYDKEKGFIAAPGKLLTIASRAPAHAPWANAGQGVDIKTSMNADDNLPKNAKSSVSSTNAQAATTNPTPPAVATVSSAPTTTPPVSKAIDKNVTATLVASSATSAATGIFKDAPIQGSTIVNTEEGYKSAIGTLALTPQQLEKGGVLKPGASKIVDAMVNAGADLQRAMPSSLFSGVVPGANNLEKLMQNIEAQTSTFVNNMQKSQNALGKIGLLTGNEAPTEIGGIVSAAATVGVNAVADTVNNTIQTVNTNINNTVDGVKDKANELLEAKEKISNVGKNIRTTGNKAAAVLAEIGKGAAAAYLSEKIGGLGGIQNALTAMGNVPSLSNLVDQAQGVAKSAFNAIKDSFKPFKAGVPQNLTQLAKENAAQAATVAMSTGTQSANEAIAKATSSIADTLSKVNPQALSNIATTKLNDLSGQINNSLSSISGLDVQASALLGDLSSSGTAITKTINNMTGVVSSISTQVTGSLVNMTTNGVEQATVTVGAIAGAGPTISAGGTQALANAAIVTQSGAQASVSSTIASGLSNLPGGNDTVASVSNNATTAVNKVPGTTELSKFIKDNATAALNNVSAQGLSTLTTLTENFSASLSGKANELTTLIGQKLQVGAMAQMQSIVSSLAGGLPGSISLPSIGFNTTDRSSIAEQTLSVLGDIGIPAPNLVGEIKQEVKDTFDSLKERYFNDAKALATALQQKKQSTTENTMTLDQEFAAASTRIDG